MYQRQYRYIQNRHSSSQRQCISCIDSQQECWIRDKKDILKENNTKLQHRSLAGLCRISNKNYLKCSISEVMIQLFLIVSLFTSAYSNGIYMTLSSSSQYVGSSSSYSLNFNRSLNTLGQQITQSQLAQDYIITIIFDPSYNISSSIAILPNNYTINTNTYTATLTLSSAINSITVSSIINPLPSQTPMKITLNFYNSSSPTVVIDTCFATLTFQPLVLSTAAISYQFTPGNVSTQSNLTINFIPFIWRSSIMALKLNFLTYWARNMLNVSSNQVLSSMSYCQPTCSISNMGSFFLVRFNSISLTGTNISITIFNILSPATLEPADTITITIIQTTYSSAVQSGNLYISASTTNNFQVLTPSTNSTIGSLVTLAISITSQDLFSSSDSIIIVMNTPVAMASQVSIANILVASNDVSVQQNSIITLSNFILVTNIPGQFSGSITITNISAQSSIKPVNNNKISLYRNGYLYDQSYFSFSANQANISSINLTLASNQANANTNLTISIGFTYGVVSNDYLYVNIDQAIAVYTCNAISCANCTCQIVSSNPILGIFSNQLKITNFGSSSSVTSTIVIIASIKNPISSNYVLYFTATDASNYTKQVGSQAFPATTQSVIPSSIFTLNNTSNDVYQVTNFSIGLNFSGYSLLNGWMTIMMDSSISLLNPNSSICVVNNNNGLCKLSIVNSSIMANISISAQTQLYTIAIRNLRNPSSTKQFSFQVSIYDMSNLVYYTLQSPNYQVMNTYQVTPQVSSSNCTNSAINNIIISFPYLPFTPTNALIVDDSTASSLKEQSILKKIVYPVNFSSNVSLTITNSYSLQPVYYQLLVVTNDFQYKIFNFNFTLFNCNASSLPIISYGFTGLPQNSGSLSFVINQMAVQNNPNSPLINGINYLTILFPSQYSSNMTILSSAQSTAQLGPRYFNLTIGNTQPISINIWSFSNAISGFITIQAYSLSQSSTQFTYLVSGNSNTVKYNISLITNCIFPCKICSSNNNNACLQCYSSATTNYYFLDPATLSCVAPSSCSSNTFPNYTINYCVVCPPQCLTCTSSASCSSCASNYYLLNSTCLTDCPAGYYPVNIQQICAICNSVNNSAHCDKCISLNVCSTCLYPYYLNPSTKTCVVACLSSEIPLNSTCYSCLASCSTCQGTTSNCTSCVTGYYLLSNTCISTCPSPYVPSTTTNDCINCSSICLLCMINSTTCTSCQYPLKLLNSTCINNCPVGYYTYAASNNTLQCLICPFQCSVCTSQSNCSNCISSYYFYNYNCITSCPISTFSTTITNNNTVTAVCSSCISNCLTCVTSGSCSQCQLGYYIATTANGTLCVSVCNTGQYLNGNTCTDCSSNCVKCLDSTLCILCATGYSLQNSLCVSNCSTSYVSILDNVVLPSSNNTTYVCKACYQIFQYCSTCIASACSTCSIGYIMNYDKTCVAICSSGYINISNYCVSCNNECKTCSIVQNNCTQCNQGYVYYHNATSNINQCLANCISGTFVLNGVCTACSSPCLTCVNSSTLCVSCMSNFYALINNGLSCVSACPSNSYIYNSQCIYCDQSCSICDANGCLTCSPHYYNNQGTKIGNNTYYECFTSCPGNIPYLINNTCYQCPSNCQICNATNCLQCINGTYAYQLYCLVQCPPGMMPSSGVCILIPADGNTNSTNNTANSTVSASSIIPVPFSISCSIVMTTIIISKLLHPNTSVSVAIFSLISVLAIICNIFYLVKSLTGNFNQDKSIYSVILMIGLLINYINNILFFFVSKFTLLKDQEFSCWRRGNVQLIKEEKHDANQPSHNNLQDHLNSDFNSELTDNKVPKKFYTYQCVWYSVITLGLFSSQNLYTLVFSKLFDLSIFKATVETVKNLKILNYVWVVALLAHLICLTSGIIEAALTHPTSDQYLQHIYESVDLIFLNFISLLFGLLLLRKKRQVWERQRPKSTGDEANSTKKVIFDHQSHNIDMNGQVQNQSEVNGKIKNLFDTDKGGSQHELVGESYKSSTNQEGSVLYFQKQDGEDLDKSNEIKLDNNILWMQINPHEMEPQLVQKDDSHLFDQSRPQAKSPQKNKDKYTLNPDNNLETLDFNQIQPQKNQEQQDQSQQKEDSRSDQYKNEVADQGEQWQVDQNEEGDKNLPGRQLKKQASIKSNKSKSYNSKMLSNDNQDQAFNHYNEENLNNEYYSESIVPSEQSKLPSIIQDSQNNEKDEQQLIKLDQKINQAESLKRIQNSSNNINTQYKKQTVKNTKQQKEIIKNQAIDHLMDENNDSSFLNKSQQQNEEELMMKNQENTAQNNLTKPLQSDQVESINRQQIENILQGEQYISNPLEEGYYVAKREIKTEQGHRKRRNKQELQSRYIQQVQDHQNQSKQTSQMSGLYQLFNQYQSQGSPRIPPPNIDQILNQQMLSIHGDTSNSLREEAKQPLSNAKDNQKVSNSPKNNQISPKINKVSSMIKKESSPKNDKKRYRNYNQYDSIKQQANELRMSNSAHNFTNKAKLNQYQKEQFRPMLHEHDNDYEDSTRPANYRTLNHNNIDKQDTSQSQSLKKSIYKSINIAKINNRLGINDQPNPIELRTMSRDSYIKQNKTLRSQRTTSKNDLSLKKIDNDGKVSQSDKKAWKSRLITSNSRQNLNGTAKLIERKSKLADVKAKLESIYLSNK